MPDRYGNPTNEEIKAMQAKTIANRRAQRAAQIAAAAPAKARAARELQELEASRRRAEMERNKQLAIRESEKRNLDRRRAEARAAQPPPIQPPPLQPPPAQPAPVVAEATTTAIENQQASKPPPTAEDLEIQRDKALLAAKEAQQKLNNPNVSTPSNVQAEQELSKLPLSPPNYTPPTPEQRLEFEQRGTLGRQRRVPPEMEQNLEGTPSDAQRAAMRERLQSAMAEAQQQKTLGGGIDRGAPSLEAAIDSGGKKFPGDPSDIQGIPVADATRDAIEPQPYAAKAAGWPPPTATSAPDSAWRREGGEGEWYPPNVMHKDSMRADDVRELLAAFNSQASTPWGKSQLDKDFILKYGEEVYRDVWFNRKQPQHPLMGFNPFGRGGKPPLFEQTNLTTTQYNSQARVQAAAEKYSLEDLQTGSKSGQFAAQNLGGLTPEEAEQAWMMKRTRRVDPGTVTIGDM
jgi:hypothetical protein